MKKLSILIIFTFLLILSACNQQTITNSSTDRLSIDEEINNLITTGYFNNKTNPTSLNCADNLTDEIKSTKEKIDFYGGLNLNGHNYDKIKNCTIFGTDCESEPQNTEQEQIQETINSNRFNVINGCLYDGNNKSLKYNLFTYAHTNYFGQKIDSFGENLNEWFRFKDNNNLYIFLSSAAGCAGCSFNGPLLKIDLKSDLIEGKYYDLPYPGNLIFSPNKKTAIEVTWNENDNYSQPWDPYNGSSTKIYLFDILNNNRKKMLYEIPNGKSILTSSHGIYIMPNAIEWINEFNLSIQLYTTDEYGYAKSKSDDKVSITVN